MFLTSLSANFGRNSVNHVRSLMSGIFSHACALGKAERNPMREAKVLGKPKATAPTQHYCEALCGGSYLWRKA